MTITMEYRIVRYEYKVGFEGRCNGCGMILYDYKIAAYKHPYNYVHTVYCDVCIKGVNIVCNYYLEHISRWYRKCIIYDLDLAIRQYPDLVPVLTKI